jgi:serine/threonine-protein kinase RsbT
MRYASNSAPPSVGDASAALLTALQQTFPAPLANTLLMVARQRSNLPTGDLAGERLTCVLSALESSLGAYLADSARRRQCVSALQRVGSDYGGLLATEQVPWIVPLGSERDIPVVTEAARSCAKHLRMSVLGQTKLMTATAEIARNVVQYAKSGEFRFAISAKPRPNVLVIATDRGPGIADLKKVMSPQYVSKTGMGIGLQGAKRLVDEFNVESAPGQGTTVTFRRYA